MSTQCFHLMLGLHAQDAAHLPRDLVRNGEKFWHAGPSTPGYFFILKSLPSFHEREGLAERFDWSICFKIKNPPNFSREERLQRSFYLEKRAQSRCTFYLEKREAHRSFYLGAAYVYVPGNIASSCLRLVNLLVTANSTVN